MLDLSASERTVLQTRTELEKSATAARKEASQIQDADLRAQTIEAINDALARQLPIVENLIRANAEYQRSTDFGAKAALRTYIEDAHNAAKKAERDRKNVVWGTSVAGSVGPGGRRTSKKKKKNRKTEKK